MDVRTSQIWRVHAALAYHVPGAALLIHDGGEIERHIAPTTAVGADMHPGELRDLLGNLSGNFASTGAVDALDAIRAELGITPDVPVVPELLAYSPLLTDCGLGLVQVSSAALGGAFVFATTLDAQQVAPVIRVGASHPEFPRVAVCNLGLGFDEVLQVTLVVCEWSPGTTETQLRDLEQHVRSMQTDCAIAELLHYCDAY
ncbi:MAG: hypothetical protein ACOYN3_10290 [Acidimicrobiia bacterium]